MKRVRDELKTGPYYISLDEADCDGEKYYGVLIGTLCGEKLHKPLLVDLTVSELSPNAVIVRKKVTAAIAKINQMKNFSSVCI